MVSMNIFHKLIGLVFGLCSVGALYVLDAAPKYVQTQGYLLNTQSIFTKIPIWLPALIIICVWGIFAYFLWKYVEKIFDVSVYTFSLIAYLMVSITGLYLISDHASQRLFILLLTFIVFGFIYGMIHLEKGYSTHQIK